MVVTIKPKGGDPHEFQVEAAEGEEESTIAQRAVNRHDGGGDGKVTVNGWTYKYTFGTVRAPRAC